MKTEKSIPIIFKLPGFLFDQLNDWNEKKYCEIYYLKGRNNPLYLHEKNAEKTKNGLVAQYNCEEDVEKQKKIIKADNQKPTPFCLATPKFFKKKHANKLLSHKFEIGSEQISSWDIIKKILSRINKINDRDLIWDENEFEKIYKPDFFKNANYFITCKFKERVKDKVTGDLVMANANIDNETINLLNKQKISFYKFLTDIKNQIKISINISKSVKDKRLIKYYFFNELLLILISSATRGINENIPAVHSYNSYIQYLPVKIVHSILRSKFLFDNYCNKLINLDDNKLNNLDIYDIFNNL